jgi:hypothetical protein
VGRTRGDVIYLDVVFAVAAPILIVLVEPADGTLFDGPSRTAIPVLPWWLSLVFRRGIGTEIAISGRRRTTAAVRPGRPTARTRSITTAATTASGGSARARGVTAWARSAGRALFTRPRLAHRKRATLEELLIEAANCGFGDRSIGVVNKRESTRPTGFTIHRKNDLGGFTDA